MDNYTWAMVATIALTYFAIVGWVKFYKIKKAHDQYVKMSTKW